MHGKILKLMSVEFILRTRKSINIIDFNFFNSFIVRIHNLYE